MNPSEFFLYRFIPAQSTAASLENTVWECAIKAGIIHTLHLLYSGVAKASWNWSLLVEHRLGDPENSTIVLAWWSMLRNSFIKGGLAWQLTPAADANSYQQAKKVMAKAILQEYCSKISSVWMQGMPMQQTRCISRSHIKCITVLELMRVYSI